MYLPSITSHLKNNKILIKEQSGFRSYMQTKDNILFITQKTMEAFNKKQKTCAVFFDIAKAFDRVWHDGLLSKMIDLKFPRSSILFIKDYLRERTCKVKIDTCFSENINIVTGIPQGGVLSPILFSIFI